MYRFTFLFALFLAGKVFSQAPSVRYSIKGYLTNLKGRTVYLAPPFHPENGPIGFVLDSCVSTDGHFSFQGSIGEAKYISLRIKGGKQDRLKLFILDNTPTTIIGNADSLEQISILGSPALQHQVILDKSLESYLTRLKELERLRGEAIQKGDQNQDIIYARQYQSLNQDITAIKSAFIESYPKSLVSLFELNTILPFLPKEKAQTLWNQLEYSLQQHSVGKRIHDQVFDRKKEARQDFPNLILADQKNKPVSLLNYKGNVVLIDFWASWCDHCRQEHNRLKSLYKQYKDKGLQIVSISVDEDTNAWKKALQKAGLPWTQLSDRVGTRNVVGTQYRDGSIPINLLIDKDGYVIRKGLHGPELEKQLAIVFD
ncbi:thioredoxin-like domain-containing protein [Larkinella insperata]|uniref:Thioredoxin-like domain-containing protein n=1 Tax=Larkinella insperata TaxID=332158 RepID=A0ABW3QHA5_9BACT|nr:TlpA disulfide reductase family protein [Larkinella insperata]